MAVDDAALDQDRHQLHVMGFAQELRRGLGAFSNFAISFTIISIFPAPTPSPAPAPGGS